MIKLKRSQKNIRALQSKFLELGKVLEKLKLVRRSTQDLILSN
jgi:hypothetical protein